jgi:glycosyltransferase involved in cell wall biosynthesis
MDFSVIVCTYNRAANLPDCLGRLALQQDVAGMSWEVVVVDNNSSDDTRETVAELSRHLPIAVRYVFEGKQGLNHARNRGIIDSSGRYFAFVDDDILVSPRWLTSLHRALQDYNADAVGSCIHLPESTQLPNWIAPDMYGFLGYQDYGPTPRVLDGTTQYPFGGNMSFNRRVVDKIGLFDTSLGRRGAGRKRSELFKGAETDYFQRLASAGGRILYIPDALVYHRIMPFQLEKSYFRTIHFNAGYQKAYFDSTAYRRTFLGVPLFLYRQLVRNILLYLIQLATRGSNQAFRQQMTVGHFSGMLLGYYQRARGTAG